MAAKSRPSLRQVLDEPVIDLLWPRAALMQLANTSIAPTEVESGAYGNRGAQRWQATMDYLRLIAGSDDESLAMLVREVNRVHATVRVPEGTAGRRRPAFDSENQSWVTATWFQSMIDCYRLFISDIDDDVLDELLAEFGRVGTVLQMKTEHWPSTYAEFSDYVRAAELRYPVRLERSGPDVSPERLLPGDVAAQVFSTYSLPRRQVRSMPLIRLLSWGMAGEVVREVYGTPWTPEHQARFELEAAKMRARQLRRPGCWRRRKAAKQRRRAEAKLRKFENRSFMEIKAREARLARSEESA